MDTIEEIEAIKAKLGDRLDRLENILMRLLAVVDGNKKAPGGAVVSD